MPPQHSIANIKAKSTKYCICIPILNEGVKFQKQLSKMHELGLDKLADIIILDRDSSDQSTEIDFLKSMGIRALIKIHEGRQGSQLRVGFNYVIEQNYAGVITIDGNNKDSIEDIPNFIQALEEGYDFIQGSRYIPGGQGINTPILRHIAVKFIHAPWISLLAGFWFTDTTSAFRGISKTVLQNPSLNLFRDVFVGYELLFYMSAKIPRLNYKIKEIPVIRAYPQTGKTPTKISFWGNFTIIKELIKLSLGAYN